MEKPVLGIDIGTTGAKAVLVDGAGAALASAYRGYPLHREGGNRVEQDPEDWWRALCQVVKECAGAASGEIACLCLSTQGGSTAAVDRDGKPLRRAISWMDQRAGKQAAELQSLHPDDFYYRRCGWPVTAGLCLGHIRWLRENEPGVFARAYRFVTTLDYLQYRLTGRFVTDETNAGITELCDIGAGNWDPELMELAGISPERLSVIRPAGETIGALTAAAAAELGLPEGVAVANGVHDQYAVAVSCGALRPGGLMLATGTAWAAMGVFDRPVYDADSRVAPGRHVLPGSYGCMGTVPVGGAVMEWFLERFGQPGESLRDVDKAAAERIDPARGLFFFPYVTGSGYPTWNAGAKGVFAGLGLEHDRYDMALAVMEGVAFEAAALLENLRLHGGESAQSGTDAPVKMLGGAARSPLWSGIVAAVLDCDVEIHPGTESACMGAAILAGAASGVFASLEEGAARTASARALVRPDRLRCVHYGEKLRRYREAVPAAAGFPAGTRPTGKEG